MQSNSINSAIFSSPAFQTQQISESFLESSPILHMSCYSQPGAELSVKGRGVKPPFRLRRFRELGLEIDDVAVRSPRPVCFVCRYQMDEEARVQQLMMEGHPRASAVSIARLETLIADAVAEKDAAVRHRS